MGKKLSQEEVSERITKSFAERVEVISEYTNRRSPIKLRCLECGHEWESVAQNVLYGDLEKNGLHRCPKCKNTKEGQYIKCAYCGKEIFRTKKEILRNKSGYFYCSKECGNRHKNLLRRNNGDWDLSKNCRLRAMNKYKHECLCCGWNEDERILEVHHIDEDHSNNSIDNLCILCPICHRKITLGYYELDLENKRLVKK